MRELKRRKLIWQIENVKNNIEKSEIEILEFRSDKEDRIEQFKKQLKDLTEQLKQDKGGQG